MQWEERQENCRFKKFRQHMFYECGATESEQYTRVQLLL